jgi:dihydrofolate synthase/folylpolyglutamate synthase
MSGDLNSYAAARHYLYGLKHRGALYGIDRMGRFVEALGHPQKRYPVVHVAGTNGKGSTCAMMEAIFREAGLTTGLFTSPHLVHQGERVQINRKILSHADIGRFTHQLRPVAEEIERTYPGHHPTFFEFMTGMAFLRFAEANVDVGIIETGLGGRLDATNVVDPELCIITSIGLDHTEILGPTLAHIAREKAGIIKRGVPLVLGLVPPEAEAVIREVAASQNSPVHAVREVFGEDASNYPACALSGLYQRRNAATATLAARVLASRFSITDTHIKAALDAVSWPGRWDLHALVDRSIILDATHNEEGCAYLDENLAGLAAQQGRKLTIIAGTLGEARAASLMPVVCRHARDLFLVEPQQPRACSFAQLEACIPHSFTGTLHRSSVRELFPLQGQTTAGCPAETIVATGSIYLIGEIMDAIHHAQPVDEGILQD